MISGNMFFIFLEVQIVQILFMKFTNNLLKYMKRKGILVKVLTTV